jgi:hypothetical protein
VVCIRTSHVAIYERDVGIVKRYGDRYKLVFMKSKRIPGYEEVLDDWELFRRKYVLDDWELFRRKYGLNEKAAGKLENNISRAKSRIYEIATCNEWSHFITGTLDASKYDRYDLPAFRKDLSVFIMNQRRIASAPDLKYLIIPEQHKDGAWHFHGLMNGINPKMLSEFGPNVPERIRTRYRNYLAYSKKFGFCSVGEIKNHEAVAAYITKYISKDMAKNNISLGNHLYYCSKGLKRAEKIKEGKLVTSPPSWDYENDYVKVKWIRKEDIDKYII